MKKRKLIGAFLATLMSVSCITSLSVTASAASVKCSTIYTKDYTTLKLTAVNAGDKIYYTLDGSDPTTDSLLYTKKLGFREPKTVKVAEFNSSGELVGKIKTVEIERLLPKPKLVVFDKLDGTAKVTASCEVENAVIHYTTDGSEPTENSEILEDGHVLTVKKDNEIKAVSVLKGWKTSAVASIKPLDLVTEDSYSDYVHTALEITNKIRAEHGLYALKLNKKLCDAALLRAKELSTNYDNGHTRPNGQRWVTTLKEFGYIHKYASENYGKLDRSGINPEEIMELWMISRAHSDAILNTDGKDVGFGFYQADGYVYWIQLFGEVMS
ncbi:MAG: chitobiase/beta-hexosaminidase C-terminal domain-containing protein [Ruminiclostridium sp.]|nr:chitobiase/beta-hexosaminidase C-terminal domain-containing protein [Ruminiclostridium sp.]